MTGAPTTPDQGGQSTGASAHIDTIALARYFAANIPNFDGELQAEIVHGGRSNLTYRITDGVRNWVLRRPPLGRVAPTAHDVGREFRVMAALGSTPVPVPTAIAFCADPTVIGAPFSVVSMVNGRVVRTEAQSAALEPTDAARSANALVAGLVAIHAVPYQEVGLNGLGRPDHYLSRQVNRWRRQWEVVATRSLPALEELHGCLVEAVPPTSDVSIVHGDYRLDNVILDPTEAGTLAAVLDWEMATIGDPLADLGLLLVYWDPITAPVLPEGHAISANPGFPTSDEIASNYAALSGRSLNRLAFYQALGYFKLAVIAEGIHNRFLEHLTVGGGFETVGDAVIPLVNAGLKVVQF